MCGIAGYFDPSASNSAEWLSRLGAEMAGLLSHRGPDDQGVWVDERAGIALGHRRLSIVDLSPSGHQPMISSDGNLVIAFNGEIYNHRELRAALESASVKFRGNSDTEVLIEGIARWGLREALGRTNGMFAFVVWNRQQRTLHLARDRFGEKPLYYGIANKALFFSSELKALRCVPAFDRTIDTGAIRQFFRHNYIPAPHSIYKGVKKLLPGTFVSAGPVSCEPGPATEYWSARNVAEAGSRNQLDLTAEDARTELDRHLRRAVGLRMVADVPVGAFLSGGIDSSAVVAIMQSLSSRPVRTFTIGFENQLFDESPYAAQVAAHLGTEHQALCVSEGEAREVIPTLAEMYDEPFADSSQIPTALVSRLARQSVTVALSGDGGDELFGGYNRYAWGQEIWDRVKHVPLAGQALLAKALRIIQPATWDRLMTRFSPLLPDGLAVRNPGNKVHKLAEVLGCRSREEMYLRLVSHWRDGEVVPQGWDYPSRLTDAASPGGFSDFISSMMYLDTVTYLPDDILVKVDRATMSVGLEARVPMLDPELFAFAWRLPVRLKCSGVTGKVVLRNVLHQYVPSQMVERPKMGFGIPVGEWIRGPLRAWAEDLLSDNLLHRQGLLDRKIVRKKWAEHVSGDRDWQEDIWGALMFQSWMARFSVS